MKRSKLACKRLKKNSEESNALAYLWGYLSGMERYEHVTPQDVTRAMDHVVSFFPKLFDHKPYE